MTIHELVRHAYRFCGCMSEKQTTETLTEYEVLAFEASCNMITQFSKNMTLVMKKEEIEMQEALDKKNKDEDES